MSEYNPMSTAELRLRLKGMPEILGQLGALDQRQRELNKSWTQISKDGAANYVVTLKQARALSQQLGGDTEKVAGYLKLAGVSARDTKLLVGQLGKELDQGRKKALGISDAMDKSKQSGNDFAKSVRDGHFASEMLLRTLDAVKDKMNELAEMSGMKGLKESTTDGFKLEANFNDLRDSMKLSNDELALYKKNVAEVSQATGISQEKLTGAAIEVQEKADKGRALFLDNNGALGMSLAVNTVAQRGEEDTSGSFLAGVNAMQDLGITEQQLPKAQGIVRVGEQKGAISSKNLLVEMGGQISQLAQKRGTSGLEAIAEGAAVAQSVASAPGFKGKDQLSQVKTVFQNFLGKIGTEKVQDALQVAGVKSFDVDKKTNSAKMRITSSIIEQIVNAQEKGKIKAVGDGSLESIFPDQEVRRFVQAIGFKKMVDGKATYPALELLKELEKAKPEEGQGMIQSTFENRLKDRDYYKNIVNSRTMAQHYTDFNERADTINYVGEAKSQFEADHPWLSQVAEPAISALGAVPKYGKALVPMAYGTLAGMAALDLKAGGRASANQQSVSFAREMRTGAWVEDAKERDADLEKVSKNLESASKALTLAAEKLESGQSGFQITMSPDGSFAVTKSKTTSKHAARGDAARKPKPGQG